jgi:uncharacterized RDD family membrane protein YckC
MGGPTGLPGKLAEYDKRVIAGLIDYVAPFVPAILLSALKAGLFALLLDVVAIGWIVYQKIQEGNTGQSLGKQVAGTRLISERTGQPVGAGVAIGRWLLHFVDGICCVGYLFPLWDAKKQTFADKIVSTVVVEA